MSQAIYYLTPKLNGLKSKSRGKNKMYHSFYKYFTPKQAFKKKANPMYLTLKDYEEAAKDNSICMACNNSPVWKLVGTGMCFTCTTGEADASEDYELI